MCKVIRFIFILGIIIMSASVNTSAQRYKCMSNNPDEKRTIWKPRYSARPGMQTSVAVSYDATSTVLTVKFSSQSKGGVVDVYLNGAKVAGVTANSGTTFSCRLREYGTGNYNVIVSSGNTVIDNKNFTVR